MNYERYFPGDTSPYLMEWIVAETFWYIRLRLIFGLYVSIVVRVLVYDRK